MSEYITLASLPKDEAEAYDVIAGLGSDDLLLLHVDCKKTVLSWEGPLTENQERLVRLGLAVTRRARHVRETKQTKRAPAKKKEVTLEDLM